MSTVRDATASPKLPRVSYVGLLVGLWVLYLMVKGFRGMNRVVVDGVVWKRQEVEAAGPEELRRLLGHAIVNRDERLAAWVFPAFAEQHGPEALGRAGGEDAGGLDDAGLAAGLGPGIASLPERQRGLLVVQMELRPAYVLGQHYLRQANQHRRKGGNQSVFDTNRALAMACLERARELAGEMPESRRPFDEGGFPAAVAAGGAVALAAYAGMAAATYETAMYMQYKQPLQSNVGMGGGTVGGGG